MNIENDRDLIKEKFKQQSGKVVVAFILLSLALLSDITCFRDPIISFVTIPTLQLLLWIIIVFTELREYFFYKQLTKAIGQRMDYLDSQYGQLFYILYGISILLYVIHIVAFITLLFFIQRLQTKFDKQFDNCFFYSISNTAFQYITCLTSLSVNILFCYSQTIIFWKVLNLHILKYKFEKERQVILQETELRSDSKVDLEYSVQPDLLVYKKGITENGFQSSKIMKSDSTQLNSQLIESHTSKEIQGVATIQKFFNLTANCVYCQLPLSQNSIKSILCNHLMHNRCYKRVRKDTNSCIICGDIYIDD